MLWTRVKTTMGETKMKKKRKQNQMAAALGENSGVGLYR